MNIVYSMAIDMCPGTLPNEVARGSHPQRQLQVLSREAIIKTETWFDFLGWICLLFRSDLVH